MTSAPTLGSLLRALRERHGWTLKEMSDRTGIPRSTLAKVEHDRLTLGYDKLLQISQRLKMRLSELISAGDEAEPRMLTRRSVGTMDNALRVETPSYEYFFMCPDLSKKKIIPIYGRVRAKSLEEFGDLLRHAGEESTSIQAWVMRICWPPDVRRLGLSPGARVTTRSSLTHWRAPHLSRPTSRPNASWRPHRNLPESPYEARANGAEEAAAAARISRPKRRPPRGVGELLLQFV
jgi:transcriptional regulator with XRE-family HTH domain